MTNPPGAGVTWHRGLVRGVLLVGASAVCLATAACRKAPTAADAARAKGAAIRAAQPATSHTASRPARRASGAIFSHRRRVQAPKVAGQTVSGAVVAMARAPHAPRHFSAPSDPATAARLTAFTADFMAAGSDERRLELLEGLGAECTPGVIRAVAQALGAESADVRKAALELLADYAAPDVVPVVVRGMADREKDVRLAALGAVAAVHDPAVVPVLVQGLADAEEDVRQTALLLLGDQDTAVLYPVVREGFKVKDAAIRETLLDLLQAHPSHAAMDILVTAFADPSPAFRESVGRAIDFLVSKEFKDAAEAKAWWEKNRGHYDAELFERDTTSAP